MFHLQWRQPDYGASRLSSLTTAIYGGQGVPQEFLHKMLAMAPRIGTGLGLTEASAFCTYTPLSGDAGEIGGTLGRAAPLYPVTIRRPMRRDGGAGEEAPAGEVGHVCFRGPQTFLGYVNNCEATRQAVSRDGWLYTGDMGLIDSRGLKLVGRARWIIKPAGNDPVSHDLHAIGRVPDPGGLEENLEKGGPAAFRKV
jgi:fatty-acyl-CoA synthase